MTVSIPMAQDVTFRIQSTPLPVAHEVLCVFVYLMDAIPLSCLSKSPACFYFWPVTFDVFSAWNSLPPDFAWLSSMQNVIQMSLPSQGFLWTNISKLEMCSPPCTLNLISFFSFIHLRLYKLSFLCMYLCSYVYFSVFITCVPSKMKDLWMQSLIYLICLLLNHQGLKRSLILVSIQIPVV